eukprot:605495-Rhodomonas_salina.3
MHTCPSPPPVLTYPTLLPAHIDGAAKDLRDAKFDPDFHLEIFFTSPPNLRGCGPNLSQERRSSAQVRAVFHAYPVLRWRMRTAVSTGMRLRYATSDTEPATRCPVLWWRGVVTTRYQARVRWYYLLHDVQY